MSRLTHLILSDELLEWKNREEKLQKEYKEAGISMGEAAWLNCDWHDNFAFDDAQRTFQVLGEKLNEVQNILSNASIISKTNELIVAVWHKIKILINNQDIQEIQIWWYQTPVKWRISYNAPIVAPLIGKEIWDIVEVNINGVNKEIEILDIQ